MNQKAVRRPARRAFSALLSRDQEEVIAGLAEAVDADPGELLVALAFMRLQANMINDAQMELGEALWRYVHHDELPSHGCALCEDWLELAGLSRPQQQS